MEIGQELDCFIKNSIDHILGLNIPEQSLQLKLESLEMINLRLRDQYLCVQSKLQEKESALQLARSEANMNAQSIKKFVEENGKLASECKYLASQCEKWEQECSLYDHDREALMEFGNEADERAAEAECRVMELQEELRSVGDQLEYYKLQYETLSVGSSAAVKVESSVDSPPSEQILLNSLVASLVNENEVAKTALTFLEANSGVETYRELLEMWSSLRPETQNVLSLASNVKTLQKAKEHLRINLNRAEEEVNVLAEENNALVEENKKLLKLCHSERKHAGSGEKRDSSARTKNSKRKASPGMSSPIDRKIDFNDVDSLRYPLSPLKENSPGSTKSWKSK
ncbi:uncharacterized protein LOC141585902 [Silene latifolia]|uniref:uncharacterized protein LOC141585902 n=1 Tax=Silene latifolia TaxID=37657 RepID=UPI003D782CF2